MFRRHSWEPVGKRQMRNRIKKAVESHMTSLEGSMIQATQQMSSECSVGRATESMYTSSLPNVTSVAPHALCPLPEQDTPVNLEALENVECNDECDIDTLTGQIQHINRENPLPMQDARNSGENRMTLRQQLQGWLVDSGTSIADGRKLLAILRPHHPELPQDARTLVRTPRSCPSAKIGTGDFCYLGIASVVKAKFSQCVPPGTTLTFVFNVDGLAISKSSNKQVWPILGMIDECPQKPFVIAVYYGTSKPCPIELYLQDFIEEFTSLLTNGLAWNNKAYTCSIRAFICDAPARSFLKCVKGHGGYFACEKCVVQGEHDGKRMTYTDVNAALRQDCDFSTHPNDPSYEEHHLGRSPLTKLPIGLVSQFPLDTMHLIFIGVVGKLIRSWISGDYHVRLGARYTRAISNRLEAIALHCPSEFSRPPRSLQFLERWKATEYRQFLLYFGPVALKDILPIPLYEHFLVLSSAVRIFSSSYFKSHRAYAHSLLRSFVDLTSELYNPVMVVYNVHNLIHLAGDVEVHGELNNFSAFPFENYLGQLKRIIRKPNQVAQQIYKRVCEMNLCTQDFNKDDSNILAGQHYNGPVPPGFLGAQFREVNLVNFKVKLNGKDSWCATEERTMCVQNILQDIDGSLMLYGVVCKDTDNYFTTPCNSTLLHIHQVTLPTPRDTLTAWNISVVKWKCVLVPLSEHDAVIFPMLHNM